MRMFNYIFIVLMGTYTIAFGAIVNTKHNLSVSNTVGTVKATQEQEICVFCHIPHSAQTGAPLWNRAMPSSAYTMYTSDYLERGGYPLPTELGSTDDTPGTLSRQCMSCHDGTVAVGSVYLLRGTVLGTTLIDMTGVDTGTGSILGTATTNFGTNLVKHHPVGVEYDPTLFALTDDFDVGTKNSELKTTPDAPIKLYNYAGKNYVECTSCHDPHLENGKFLRVTGGSHGVNVNTTCNSCHDKEGWSGSAHQASTGLYTDTAVSTDYGTDKVSDLGCINCHTPHNGEGAPYLLRKVEQNTCFQGAAGTTSTAPCHGTGNSTGTRNDIESQVTKVFAHPVTTIDGVHTNLDAIYGTSLPDPGKGVEWGDAKHAECMDCHNQHKATPGTHTPADQWYPTTTSTTTNNISNALNGASGVEPAWVNTWTQPTGFTTLESATQEYQICMKCHSYWGLGTAPEGVSGYPLSNEPINATDQAFEFNPKNRSAHPVVMTTNDMDIAGGNAGNDPTLDGRYAPPLTAAALQAPWSGSPGNQTMYCSDCHGANNENTTDPKGPHGSSNNFMLKGAATNWPADSTGVLFQMDDGQATTATSNPKGIFCLNCHIYEPGDGTITVHSTTRNGMSTAACVECHVAVPHGSKVSRLLGYATMPEPYNYLGNTLKMDRFRQETASSYTGGSNNNQKLNVFSLDTASCGQGGCHDTNDGTNYDGW